ncbi:Tat pathway signal protein [Fulvitalea axinellae]|uniref:Tat pathway signal protein n=1 Tax=Fulvitalea axinellae TaxID=1182444 RepID=A0AAU9CNT8_9BACT|nr:Tat pathway signal protein [Fulvitalea axinellae]
MKDSKKISRRKFMGQASCAAVGTLSLYSSVFNLGMANALATPNQDDDYKALVCVLLAGGNDSFNMLAPTNGHFYNDYKNTRANLALANNQLRKINFRDNDGRQFGLHPAMSDIQKLFNDKKIAMISNVGTLVEPITKSDYLNRSKRLPLGLLSHADQVMHWQTSMPHSRSARGWAGRIADIMNTQNENDRISMNISLSGSNIFQAGNKTHQYAIRSSERNGSVGIAPFESGEWYDKPLRKGIDSLLSQQYGNVFKQTFAQKTKTAHDNHEEFSQALEENGRISTNFGDSQFEQDMKMVARTVAARKKLGMKRQVFFVLYGGWDHHDNVLASQQEMLSTVSKGFGQFDKAMRELGTDNNVTTFLTSDFGRTLTSNGNGTDHAWGGNVMVMGGAVNGGRVYGKYPDIKLKSQFEVGGGIFVPTLSTDEYFAELSLWFGVAPSELETILPNLSNFHNVRSGDLPIGFMKKA